MNINISPSVLSANFTKLVDDIKVVEDLGVTRLHLDVMDGHFVPNLTFGPFIIKQIREITTLHLETHLMIENPHLYIEKYADVGSDTIIIHQEASKDLESDLQLIRSKNVKSGVAINPDTDIKTIDKYLKYIDYILIMSVFPGFGGQKFIDKTLEKMSYAVSLKNKYDIIVGVDGGVNLNTIKRVYKTGIDVSIIGSALYGAEDIPRRYEELTSV